MNLQHLLLLLLYLFIPCTPSPLSWTKEAILGPSDLTPDREPETLLAQYDFIVVGAGSAGSAVAARLSEVPQWRVLLVEAGGDESAITDIPFISPTLSGTQYDWNYRTEPDGKSSLGLKGQSSRWHRGKGMGGSSITNAMMYNRGHPRDYDTWESLGNPGWGWKDVKKYFIKSERAHGAIEKSPHHGKNGVLDVSDTIRYRTKLADVFLDSGLELGYEIVDYNSEDIIGFSHIQVTMRNGTRCSANKAFLRPARNRSNLHVVKWAHVTKILIKSMKAYGIEFNKRGELWRIEVSKEIILSAGAINTPQILMLSGIGPRKHLTSLGITVFKNLPGVGQNLQDHVSYTGLNFYINESIGWMPAMATADQSIYHYIDNQTCILTSLAVGESVAFISTNISKYPKDHPDMELIFGSSHLGNDKGVMRNHLGIKDDIFDTVFKPNSGKPGWSVLPIVLLPLSKGNIRLKSKNPYVYPQINNNYFDNEHDLKTLVEGIKAVIKISQTNAFQKYGSLINDIPLPACEGKEFGSDEYWECAVRHFKTTIYHYCGTAKMGIYADPLAVVDAQLRVYGVRGLRVVDASIMPKIPASHTNAPSIMIGEKAADIIKLAYGIQTGE